MSKRIRRRLSMTSGSASPRRDVSPNNTQKENGFMDGLFGSFGYGNGNIDESESKDVEEDSVVRNHTGRENTLRRRRNIKFASPAELVQNVRDDKGFLGKLAKPAIKTFDMGIKTFEAAIPNRDRARIQPEVLEQKVAVSDIEKLAQKVS